MRRLLLSVLLLAALPLLAPARAQSTSNLPVDHSPRGALWRAAAAPGWGQIYNRQYYKLPFVYVGLGGLLAYGIYTQRRVVLLRRAHRYADWYAVDNRYEEDRDAFLQVLRERGITEPPEDPSSFEGTLLSSRENTKRNRNLLFIASGLYYALTVLDAYVSAHLLDFNVNEDLTMQVTPRGEGIGVRATLHLR